MVFERRGPDAKEVESSLIRRINDNTRRIRMIEQRLDVVDSRIKGIEEKVIEEFNSLRKNFDQLSLNLEEFSKNLNEMRGEILRINKILEKTAGKVELKELKNLLDLYNPLGTQFVTKEQLERILEEKTSKR